MIISYVLLVMLVLSLFCVNLVIVLLLLMDYISYFIYFSLISLVYCMMFMFYLVSFNFCFNPWVFYPSPSSFSMPFKLFILYIVDSPSPLSVFYSIYLNIQILTYKYHLGLLDKFKVGGSICMSNLTTLLSN